MKSDLWELETFVTVGGVKLQLFGSADIDNPDAGAAILLDISPLVNERRSFLELFSVSAPEGEFDEFNDDLTDVWEGLISEEDFERITSVPYTWEDLNAMSIEQRLEPLPPQQLSLPLGEGKSKLLRMIESAKLTESLSSSVYKVCIENIDGAYVGFFEGATPLAAAESALAVLVRDYGFFPENKIVEVNGTMLLMVDEDPEYLLERDDTFIVTVTEGLELNVFSTTP